MPEDFAGLWTNACGGGNAFRKEMKKVSKYGSSNLQIYFQFRK